MNRSASAALLSALVFPGVGQLYLGRRLRGWLIVLVALAAALYVTVEVVGPVLGLVTEIEDGRLALDPVLIAARLEQQGQAVNPLHTVAMLAMLACWMGATVDAYLLGRQAKSG
jgi:hypothetical protein